MVGGTMYLRRCRQHSTSGTYSYWKLVESVRTARGPRQRVVAYLGDLDEAGRLGLRQAAQGAAAGEAMPRLFAEGVPVPRFVEIDPARIEVENPRDFVRHPISNRAKTPHLLPKTQRIAFYAVQHGQEEAVFPPYHRWRRREKVSA